jgi:hypothetical protein
LNCARELRTELNVHDDWLREAERPLLAELRLHIFRGNDQSVLANVASGASTPVSFTRLNRDEHARANAMQFTTAPNVGRLIENTYAVAVMGMALGAVGGFYTNYRLTYVGN